MKLRAWWEAYDNGLIIATALACDSPHTPPPNSIWMKKKG